MNTLSLLIYAAGVATSVKVVSGIGIATCLLGFLFAPPKGVKAFSYDHGPMDGFSRKGIWVALFVCVFLAVFVPSSQTIYMIAASEVGEQVVNTPEAREVLDAVRRRIMEELRVGGDE